MHCKKSKKTTRTTTKHHRRAKNGHHKAKPSATISDPRPFRGDKNK